MNTDELQRPLSKAELEEIHAILEHGAAGLVPAALDGFLTAVGSMPTGLMPSDWLPRVLGDFEFQDKGDFSQFAGLVLRRYNEVLRRTGRSDSPWPPASLGDAEVRDWCDGYLEVATADPNWLSDEWARDQLFGISALAGKIDLVGEQDVDGNIIEDAAAFLVATRRQLPETVNKLDEYWRKRRQMDLQRPSPLLSDKTGRNEPCPCDSGRKYKKCCGRSA